MKLSVIIRKLIFPAAVAVAGNCYSRQQPPTQAIEKITVFESKPVRSAALTTTTVDSVAMAETAGATFAELLSKHTTLFVKSYGLGSLATVSFRGTSASHTQVEWNGLNINGPMMGQVDFSQVPVWLTDRVELMHGGSSLQNGSGALGGLIAINSAPEWGERFYGTVGQSAGSYGAWQTFVAAGGGNEKVQAKVRYVFDKAENDFKYLNRAIPPFERTRLTEAQYIKHGASADLFWNAGRGNIFSVNLWYHTSDRNLPADMLYEGAGRKENQLDDELRMAVKWAKYTDKLKSEFIFGFTRASLDYTLEHLTGLGTTTSADTRSEMTSLQLRYDLEYALAAKTVIQIKADGRYDDVSADDRRQSTGYSADRMAYGLSASIHHRFDERLSGFILLREDITSGDFSPVMPAVGIEYTPLTDRSFKLSVNGARNYRHPTLNELHWNPGGNPDLRPERGYTADISAGYDKLSGKVRYSATVTGYGSWMDDWIFWRPKDDSSGYRFSSPENMKKVFSRGFEILASATFYGRHVTSAIGGNYAFTRTTNQKPLYEGDGSVDRQLVYIPVHKANVIYSGTYRGWYVYWVWSVVGERFTTSSNETTRHSLPAYDLHDATVGKNISLGRVRLNAELKCNNVFGRQYRALLWRPMPMRNYNFTLKLMF